MPEYKMQLANFLLSDTKWNPTVGILSVLEKPGRVDWKEVTKLLNKKCGHCKEYGGYCVKCSLGKAKLCSLIGVSNYAYWILRDMIRGAIPRNKRKALRIARNMYAAILKDDPGREG